MLSLSHVNITQQPSNQPKKWHNEDVSLGNGAHRCVHAGVCVSASVRVNIVYLAGIKGRFQ